MEIQSAINFLVGSVLFSSGLIVISGMAIALNNLFSKYWKPVQWTIYNPVEYRFVDTKTMTEVQIPDPTDKIQKPKK
jgi:hypothetical protein